MLLFLLLPFSLVAHSEKSDSVTVTGEVFNSFTRESIYGAFVEFVRSDGVVIASDSTRKRQWAMVGPDMIKEVSPEGFRLKVPSVGSYKVRIHANDYEPLEAEITIPERKYMKRVRDWSKNFDLKRASRSNQKDIALRGAVVRATRVKMVMKGDTVVYDAAAFQLSEGSMLDELIASMPGMKIEREGNITYNGQHVEDLLVNGEDFFKGNPKIALENLPAYTVQKVKVYRRSADYDYLLTDSSQKERNKRLVVDVNLKRQYNQGWMGNVEVGGGTADKYLAKLFAMRYTDHSKLFLYGAMNNVNQTSVMGSDGYWADFADDEGVSHVRNGGIEFNVKDRKSKTSFTADVSGFYSKSTQETKESAVNYLTGGDTYSRSRSNLLSRMSNASLKLNLSMPYKRFYLNVEPEISYTHSRVGSNNFAATFNRKPFELGRCAVIDTLKSNSNSWKTDSTLVTYTSSPMYYDQKSLLARYFAVLMFKDPLFGNSVNMYLKGTAERSDKDMFNRYLLAQPGAAADAQSTYHNRYDLNPIRKFDYMTFIEYRLPEFSIVSVCLRYEQAQKFEKGVRKLYRMDWLGGAWADPSLKTLGDLPSTQDSLSRVLDEQNSYYTVNRTLTHTPQVDVTVNLKKSGVLFLQFPIAMMRSTIHDVRSKDNRLARNLTSFDPNVRWMLFKSANDKNYSLELLYAMEHSLPSLSSMIDVTDDSNPLYIQSGNRNLSNVLKNRADFSFSMTQGRRNRMLNGNITWTNTDNAIAQMRTYNRETGVTYSKPQNIHGNWSLKADVSWGASLDSVGIWRGEASLGGAFVNSVDYVSDVDATDYSSMRSSVRNFSLTPQLKLTYSRRKLNVEGQAILDYSNQSSRRKNFTETNALDYIFRLKIKTPLLWKINLSTTFNTFIRRGYADSRMNDENMVWNASLSRSFLKGGRLLVTLDGYDILGQLNNIQTTVNSQGRTETWNYAAPRYVMIRFMYKINILPKKKKTSDA